MTQTSDVNELGQPIGLPLLQWTTPEVPNLDGSQGRTCRLEKLDPQRHAACLFDAYANDAEGRGWTYLPYGPFASLKAYKTWMHDTCMESDPLFYAIVDRKSERAVGVASYLRIQPAAGTIEVGHINYSPLLQRTVTGTEAMYFMMERAFECGYRRYEWKCDALNKPSRAAATRLGFEFEGVFRQATMYKGRNRDTAWYSVIDSEWPALRTGFQAWLDPENFDADGLQRARLSEFVSPARLCGHNATDRAE